MLLEIKGICKNFGGVRALENVEIIVEENERLGLIGPNGSGKTTLLNIISGTLRQDSGEIIFNGEKISNMPTYKRAEKGIARTFQVPRPFPSLTVLNNVLVPLTFVSKRWRNRTDAIDKAEEILRSVGLGSKLGVYPKELTQVEMRKLELARALALNPRLLLLDEVMAGLTSGEILEVLDLLKKLNERGITIIMVEHIMSAVMNFCERIVVLNNGSKIAEGEPGEIRGSEAVVKAYFGE
jgi:branched-chain amino acid transport system ATP-binding protein